MAAILHGGGLTAAIEAYGGEAADWLDLSTGINPVPPALPDIPIEVWNRLPDRALVDAARRAAHDWYLGGPQHGGGRAWPQARDADGPVCLPLPVPGTQALIQKLPSLVPPGRAVAILSPTYGEYAHCFSAAGFRVDALAALDELRAEHGTLVVVNPNNPDGRRLSRADLVALHGRMLAQQGHLHVDEAFGDCQPELSVADLAGRSAGLTVSRSFGKVFGLAGVRLGFVFALPDCLRAIEASLGPWAVSGPALHLARHLMTGDRLSLHEAIDQRRRGLQRVLDSAGLHLVGGTELFALVAHPDAARLFDHLANAHILVRKFDYAPDWLRIGLTPNEQEDERLERRLASFEP